MALAWGAAAILLAAPAAAATSGGTRSANAFWKVGDPKNTQISLTGRSGATPDAPGSLFLQVSQRFCDAPADQLVFRTYTSEDPIEPGAFRANRRSQMARLRASAVVKGTEQRVNGCANTTTFPTGSTALGFSPVQVVARWRATGSPHVSGPDSVTRDAVATGSITGSALDPGDLGVTRVASVRAQG